MLLSQLLPAVNAEIAKSARPLPVVSSPRLLGLSMSSNVSKCQRSSS